MQAQRTVNRTPELPSSPPTASPQEGEGLRHSEAHGVPSPTQSIWTAPSPTQTLGHSSPELPPLPSLAILGAIPRTPSRQKAKDAAYYTASWGSPYQQPPPGLDSTESTGGQREYSDSDEAEESSISLQFGLDHLLPSRFTEEDPPDLRFGLEHLIPSRLPTNQGLRSHWPTSAPIQTTPERTPRPKYLRVPASLDVGHTTSYEPASRWNGESESDKTSAECESPRRYLSSEFVKTKEKRHRTHKENLTLKQEDFWAHFSSSDKETTGRMMSSRFAGAPEPPKKDEHKRDYQTKLLTEKPLPPPPVEEAGTPLHASSMSSIQQAVNSSTGRASEWDPAAPRQRKRIPCKGRSCWLCLPPDIPRGRPGYPPLPLSEEEVATRLRNFEDAGYNIGGYEGEMVWSRPIFPDVEDTKTDDSMKAVVRVPDMSLWQEYVNYLTEQKLRALGVSLGDEEESTPMSRQPSSQHPGLPFSPPLPTSSAGSHGRHGSIMPGFPPGPSPGHVSSRSIASPMPFGNSRGSLHMQRPSTFASPVGLAPLQGTSPSIAGWSPQQYFPQVGAPRGGSPALTTSRHDLADITSPLSPFGFGPNQPFSFPQKDALLLHMQQQQQLLIQQQQSQPQPHLIHTRPSSTLAEVPEVDGEEDETGSGPDRNGEFAPDLAAPSPRDQRHNISQNLEREVRDGEYHLEEAIDRQLEEGGEFSTSSRFSVQSPVTQQTRPLTTQQDEAHWEELKSTPHVLHQPQPHNRTHSLTQPQRASPLGYSLPPPETLREESSDSTKTNLSDVTNPSVEGRRSIHSPNEASKQTQGSGHVSDLWKDSKTANHSSHGSKSSVPKFNVEAKEFKFNPNASFSPGNFSSAFSFQGGANLFSSGNNTSSQQAEPLKGLGKNLNVAAPSFQPGGSGLPSVPVTDFTFSSQMPSFKPDAQPFQPSSTDSAGSGSLLPSSIFGDIKVASSDILKPARKSKAVPIVRPDQTQQSPATNQEEREVDRNDFRQKRARYFDSAGDSVPVFASPAQPLGESTNIQSIKKDNEANRVPLPEEKENFAPVTTQVGDEDTSSTIELPETAKNHASVGIQQNPNDMDLASEEDRDLTPTPTTTMAAQSQADTSVTDIGDAPATEEESKAPGTKHASGLLPATAQPSEIKSGDGSRLNLGIHVTQPSVDHNSVEPDPPRHFSRSPATTFRPSDDGSFKTALETDKRAPYPDSEDDSYDSYAQPTFTEIDAVMRHMDERGSDFGVERDTQYWEQSHQRNHVMTGYNRANLQPMSQFRSDAPSPSSRRTLATSAHPGDDSASILQDPFSDGRAGMSFESPVHRLNDGDNVPVSEWDDAIASDQEQQLRSRSRFFDRHVDRLIDGALQSRLGPLEKNLHMIRDALNTMAHRSRFETRRSFSNEGRDSDADDEDDGAEATVENRFRHKSPRKDWKFDKIRSIVTEALASYQFTPPAGSAMPTFDMTEFYQALGDMKASIARNASVSVQLDDFREVMEEALARQNMAMIQNRQNGRTEENQDRIADLEKSLKEARQQLDDEIGARKAAERQEADARKLLKLVEEELGLVREKESDESQRSHALSEQCKELRYKLVAYQSSEEDLQKRISLITSENEALLLKNTALESVSDDLRNTVSSLSSENNALEETLAEYRLSSNKWRQDVKRAIEEKEELKRSLEALRVQSEEAMRIREQMRGKFDKLQQDMATAVGQAALEKSKWQQVDEEGKKKYEVLLARMEAEVRTRERLERELDRLEALERESVRLRVNLEQTQHAKEKLEELVTTLRQENREAQKVAERYEREFREAREAGRVEVQRTRVLLEADIEAANNHVNIVRADLESEISRVRAELDNVRMEADTAKARHELQLEEASDAKKHAVEEALLLKNTALLEQQKSFERRIEELNYAHARDLEVAKEDKQRSVFYLNERLSLADAKLEHYQDRILHLEDKVEVAKAAARAAAQAAQSAKSTNQSAVSSMPEKVSPQALRESIVVLQEQLHERESRIEDLEEQLSQVDKDGPSKLKERDTEIGWLRELLGVRLDELTDLVNTLSQPEFDRDAVRDTAIRIRANLQMEQQEKQRHLTGTQGFPTLASLSNFASPKAVQIAAAFGSWRKSRDNPSSSLSRNSSAAAPRSQTPSKAPQSRQGFLSGLMTPPTSNLRKTTQSQSDAMDPLLTPRQQDKLSKASPSTPPLLRKSSYDQDAEDGNFSTHGFYDDEESTVDDDPDDRTHNFEPFGPGLPV